jgi:hypothetical protein
VYSRLWCKGFVLLLTILFVGQVAAQSSCPMLVEQALQSIANECHLVSRNQVCYGNLAVNVTPRPTAPDFVFEKTGDITEVTYLRALKLDPLDEVRGIWGMAMMQLQANIPDTLPGQNVTFLVFGDTEIEDLTPVEQAPMQAFTLKTGLGDAACSEAPESAVIIQTPSGVESVQFNVNGVDIEVGSTIVLQAQAGRTMTINTLEGAAVVTLDGTTYPVVAGTELSIPMNDQMQPDGLPTLPTPFCLDRMSSMPVSPLKRDIGSAQPMADAELAKLHLRVKEGLTPCGVPGLSSCEHALNTNTPRTWATASQFASVPFLQPQPHTMNPNNPEGHYVAPRFCASDADRYSLPQRIAAQQKRFDRLDALENNYFVTVAPSAPEPIVIYYPQGLPQRAPEAPPPVAEVYVEQPVVDQQVATSDGGSNNDGGGGGGQSSASALPPAAPDGNSGDDDDRDGKGGRRWVIIINWGRRHWHDHDD